MVLVSVLARKIILAVIFGGAVLTAAILTLRRIFGKDGNGEPVYKAIIEWWKETWSK